MTNEDGNGTRHRTDSSVATNEFKDGWDIQKLWEKYQDTAMHFDELGMKIRTQALAFVASIVALVSVFATSNTTASPNWALVSFILGILILLWLALFALDIGYYNRLLLGSIAAILEIEIWSAVSKKAPQIQFSRRISAMLPGLTWTPSYEIPEELKNKIPDKLKTNLEDDGLLKKRDGKYEMDVTSSWARHCFYGLVLIALVAGFSVSLFCQLSADEKESTSGATSAVSMWLI